MTDKMGWCLTGQHDRCIVVSISKRRCGCECHANEESAEPQGEDGEEEDV